MTTIDVSHLCLEHEGEPIVEMNTSERTVVTLFRGLRSFPNTWNFEDLDRRVANQLQSVVRHGRPETLSSRGAYSP